MKLSHQQKLMLRMVADGGFVIRGANRRRTLNSLIRSGLVAGYVSPRITDKGRALLANLPA